MRDVLAAIGAYALVMVAVVLLLLRWTRERQRTELADPWQRYLDRRRPRPLISEWN